MESIAPVAAIGVAGTALIALPRRIAWFATFALLLGLVGWMFWLAIPVLGGGSPLQGTIPHFPIGQALTWKVDALSALFMVLVGVALVAGFLFGRGYLRLYAEEKHPVAFGLHYAAYLWLGVSMALVLMLRDMIGFLVAWELMTVSSFLLVVFDAGKDAHLRAGIRYLVQMHIGFLCLLGGFVVAQAQGPVGGFEALDTYFRTEPNWPLFALFFVGFGIKAGFFPLHSWLPEAHPAAPAHVSGVMSGVMIKMGIYGIFRVIGYLAHDLEAIGIGVLVVGMVTGLYGILMAAMQTHLKRLLAFSSIENIGIIGIGTGLGLIGWGNGNMLLATLGFYGALLHVVNHALFKPLLFFASGSVYSGTHTLELNQLGGLVKRMPRTAGLFLVGSIAICALPPLNGFASEFLIYSGILRAFQSGAVSGDLLYVLALLAMALIGGMAIFTFTKAFGIGFLGSPRSTMAAHAKEAGWEMLAAKFLLVPLMVGLGLGSTLVLPYLEGPAMVIQPGLELTKDAFGPLQPMAYGGGALLGLVGLVLLIRRWQQHKAKVVEGPTWGCGYTGADPAVHQYTATSYADNLRELGSGLAGVERRYAPMGEDEIFPAERSFQTESVDPVEAKAITRPVERLLKFVAARAVFQTGVIQHYILYGLAFLALIFVLSLTQLI